MKRLIILCAIGLAGCGTVTPPAVTPAATLLDVYKPVFSCQAPQVEKPVFPFDALPLGSDIFDQVKTLLADREVRKAYEMKLEAVQNQLHN